MLSNDTLSNIKPQTWLRDCIASLLMPCTVDADCAAVSAADPQATDKAKDRLGVP